MTILWVGGEDIDFPTKQSGFAQNTTNKRTGYARASLTATTTTGGGNSHSGAIASPQHSIWVSAYVYQGTLATSCYFCGVARSGHAGWLAVGSDSSVNNKLALYKIDDSGTPTKLASETGTSWSNSAWHKIDIHIEGLDQGGSCRTRVYLDGGANALIDYTGDPTWNAITDVDQFAWSAGRSTGTCYIEECLLADEDTRAMSVVTLAPSGAGDANTFDSGTYSDIAETTPFGASDATLISSATSGQACQFALSDLPGGTFTVKAVGITARAIRGSSGITQVKLGIRNGTGGGVNVDAGHDPGTTWADDIRRLMQTNPVTSNNFSQAEVNALQIAFESLT